MSHINAKLFSYKIGGVTPVAYLDSYSVNDLNGNEPFVVILSGETTPSNDYVEVTSDAIEICDKYGDSFFKDYQEKQRNIRNFGYEKEWDNLTNDEKDIVIKYYANPQILGDSADTQNVQVITHLMMTKGMSQDEAIDFIVDQWHGHWEKLLEDAPSRWKSVVKVAVKHLSFEDATDLFDTVENLVSCYLESGRIGQGYGDSKDGLLNYIMSTSSFDGIGLEYNAYTLKKGTWESFKKELEIEMVDKVWPHIQYHVDNLTP